MHMKALRADLHIHTCLSPCAEAEMVPSAIVTRAKAVGLDMIAVCDHNSTENVSAVAQAGARAALAVIPGIEITSREEVHVVGLFNRDDDLTGIQAQVDQSLSGQNDAAIFGTQMIVDQWDRVIGQNQRLLIGATDLSLEQVVDAIHGCGGLAVAAHIDRQRFSVVGQLGFIPEGLDLDAVEVSPRGCTHQGQGFPVVTSSDAHCLQDIGKRATSFYMAAPSVREISQALSGKDGRRILADMQDLSLHILDIIENATAASATWIKISLAEDTQKDLFLLEVRDNGKGMGAEARAQALDPFYTTRTTRRVGLGLPLLAQAAQQCEGTLTIESEPGRGTTIKAVFKSNHPDLKPLGDIAETLRTVRAGQPDLDLQFEYKIDNERVVGFGGYQGVDERAEE